MIEFIFCYLLFLKNAEKTEKVFVNPVKKLKISFCTKSWLSSYFIVVTCYFCDMRTLNAHFHHFAKYIKI